MAGLWFVREFSFAQVSSDELIQKIQKTLQDAESFKADFSMISRAVNEGPSRKMRGTIILKGNDKVSIDFIMEGPKGPTTLTLACDGIKCWKYQNISKIVTVITRDDFTKQRDPLHLKDPFNGIKTDSIQLVGEEMIEEKPVTHFQGITEEGSGENRIDLWVDSKDDLPRRVIETDKNQHEVYRVDYRNVVLNPLLFDDLFIMPPSSVPAFDIHEVDSQLEELKKQVTDSHNEE